MDMVCEKSLDSETEGVFTVGCAGGQDVRIEKELAWTDIPDTTELFKLNMQGLTGGHSGIDIHRGRANANKLLARALHYIRAACQIRLISFKGGTARKAIPRDATAAIACEAAHIRTMQNIVSDFKQTLTNEYGALAGAECRRENDYPPWQPDMDAALLKRCTDLYRKLFDREPVVQAIHAGLECAIIGSKYPGMQIISLGPTMEKAHSPDERLYIPSIERLWRFLAAYCSLSGSKNITQGIGFLS
jgi:di/tripeptidase